MAQDRLARDYRKVVINTAKGERWFCTEAEAARAGWRPRLVGILRGGRWLLDRRGKALAEEKLAGLCS